MPEHAETESMAERGGEPAPPPARWIIANLDAERDFAREAARQRSSRAGSVPGRGARLELPARVERTLAAHATLLRAFASDEDRLWLPGPVDADRLAGVAGLPVPRLEWGRLHDQPPAREILAWAETPPVARSRLPSPSRRIALAGESLHVLLWSVPAPSAGAALAANHRAFALAAREALGLLLPGERICRSVADVESHLGDGGAAASPSGLWVLKASHSAAARSRVRGKGARLEPAAARRVEKLLELHDALLFEPWMDRTADFGAPGVVLDDGVRMLEPHRLLVAPGGSFLGIGLAPHGGPHPSLAEPERDLLMETARRVGERLRAAAYRGPFGIDAWRYRRKDGKSAFHALGEINARMSFGHVARSIAERLLEGGVIEEEESVELRLGQEGEGTREVRGRRVLLTFGAADGSGAAWLEVSRPAPRVGGDALSGS